VKKPRSITTGPAPAAEPTASSPVSAPLASSEPVYRAGEQPGPVAAWVRFWFSAIDPLGLHALRVMTGILLLAWLLGFAGQVEAFFSLNGWFDRQAYKEMVKLPGGAPVPLTWSLIYLFPAGPALKGFYWASVAVVALFTLGVAPRITGILAWVAFASFVFNPPLMYDADWILIILGLYLMVGYALHGLWNSNLSPLEKVLGPWRVCLLRRPTSDRPPSVGANLAVRLLQVNVALILCISGLHKLQFGEWWGGVAMWYWLVPPMETTKAKALAYAANGTSWLWLLSLSAYVMLAWQIGFPLFAWRKRWRPVLLGGAALGWLCTFFVAHQPLFGPAYLIGCLSFLTPAEWQKGLGTLKRWLRLDRLLAAQVSAPLAAAATPARDHAPASV
jgi:hypothetical protein